MDSIQAAIAAAQAAAGNLPKQVTGEVIQTPSTLPSRGAPLSTADLLMDGGLTVDAWLKVDKHGFLVGDKKGFITEIVAEIDLSEVKAKYSIKYGNPPVYKHTYDRQLSTQNESWALVCQKAAQIDEKAREYRSADIPLVLVNDVSSGKETLAEADQVLGLTLSTTAWRPFETFLKSLAKAGVDIQNDKVMVTVGHETVTRNGNTWGLPTFELVTN